MKHYRQAGILSHTKVLALEGSALRLYVRQNIGLFGTRHRGGLLHNWSAQVEAGALNGHHFNLGASITGMLHSMNE